MTAPSVTAKWPTREPYLLSVNQGHPAIMFCFVWLYISAAGPGPWSLDAKRGK